MLKIYNMKKLTFFVAFAALVFSACSKEELRADNGSVASTNLITTNAVVTGLTGPLNTQITFTALFELTVDADSYLPMAYAISTGIANPNGFVLYCKRNGVIDLTCQGTAVMTMSSQSPVNGLYRLRAGETNRIKITYLLTDGQPGFYQAIFPAIQIYRDAGLSSGQVIPLTGVETPILRFK